MAKPRGRPTLDDFDRMEAEGCYLLARHELTVLLGRLPTVEETADHLERSPRTVEATRARMQKWRKDVAEALGWADWSGGPLHPHDGARSPRALILGDYAVGKLTTAEASRALALLGLPADPRELRRWRRGLQQSE